MTAALYPVCREPAVALLVARLDAVQREAFEERAGIIEFDAGLSRAHAECLALIDLLVRYPQCLTGLVTLQVDLDGATQWLLTTDLIFARRHLADIGAVEIAVLDPAAVVEAQYAGVAMLGTLG
jgi:hypothetical protein